MPSFDPTTGLPVLAPPGGTPLQRNLVATAAPLPAAPAAQATPGQPLSAAQMQAIFNSLPALNAPQAAATPAAATPAALAPAAAKPLLQPIAPAGNGGGAVSATPGVGNPLPPDMVPLPQGPLPTLQGSQGNQSYTPDQGVTVINGSQVMQPGGAGGAIAPTYTSAPAGGLTNPEGVINRGFDLQTQRTEHFMQQALDYINQGGNIFERATRGRAIAGILSATAGPNNVGAVQGQGADSLNGALSGVQQAGLAANASEYGSTLGLAANEQRVGEEHYKDTTDPVPVGTDIQTVKGVAYQVPRYGTRAGGMAASPISPTPAAKLEVGMSAGNQKDGTYKGPDGSTVTVKNHVVTAKTTQ